MTTDGKQRTLKYVTAGTDKLAYLERLKYKLLSM